MNHVVAVSPSILGNVLFLHVLWKNLLGQLALPLTLLFAGDNLECARVEGRLLLLLLSAGAALLGNLRPATACGLVVSRARSVAVVDDALVGELAAAKEFLSEVTGVERVAGRVNGLGDELGVSRETQKGGDEVLSWKIVSARSIAV